MAKKGRESNPFLDFEMKLRKHPSKGKYHHDITIRDLTLDNTSLGVAIYRLSMCIMIAILDIKVAIDYTKYVDFWLALVAAANHCRVLGITS